MALIQRPPQTLLKSSKSAEEVISLLRTSYTSEDILRNLNILIYGGSGSGKTFSLRTAKKPLLIASFDPLGSIALADLVASGEAIIMNYENEDAKNPTVFQKWDSDFDVLKSSGVFEKVGTYALDSLTTFSQAVLNVVLKKAGRPGMVPQQNDWYPQMVLVEEAVRRIMQTPCDSILIAHDDVQKDEIIGSISRAPMTTGKTKKRLPLLFSEVYYATTHTTSKGTEYLWQIARSSSAEARSRLRGIYGRHLNDTIPQDFTLLMKELKREYTDLPSFE